MELKVKYRTVTKSIEVPMDISLSDILKLVTDVFQESALEPENFRLGLFSGKFLIAYMSENNRDLLMDRLVVLLPAPEISSRQLASLIECVSMCLQTPLRMNEIDNLTEHIGELVQYMSCDEFTEQFVKNDGVSGLFKLAGAIGCCNYLTDSLRLSLWNHVLDGLAASMLSHSWLLTGGICDCNLFTFDFNDRGFAWETVSDQTICQLMNSLQFMSDNRVFRSCLLILLSLVRTCPNRAITLVDNSISSLIYAILDNNNKLKTPQLMASARTQSQPRLGRSGSRSAFLSVRCKLTPPVVDFFDVDGVVDAPKPTVTGQSGGITEIHLLVVLLVHAIVEASADNLEAVLARLPVHLIVTIVADLVNELGEHNGSVDISTVFPVEVPCCDPSTTSVPRPTPPPGMFNTLKSRRALPNPSGGSGWCRSHLSRNNSLAVDCRPRAPSASPPSSPSNRSMIDTSRHLADEKAAPPPLTRHLSVIIADALIGLQLFMFQPLMQMMNSPADEHLLNSTLEDFVGMVVSDQTATEPETVKDQFLRMCRFSDPGTPEADFKAPPGNLAVVCLSSLRRHRSGLIRQILEIQLIFGGRSELPATYSKSLLPPPDLTSTLSRLGAADVVGQPQFPLIPIVRALVVVLCDALGVSDNCSAKGQLIPILFHVPQNTESAFLGLFLGCFDTFYDWWFALNATFEDVEKVSGLFSRSLKSALTASSTSLDEFRDELSRASLDVVRCEWEMENEFKEKNHPAIQELRRDLVKRHTKTVTNQRLFMMSNGPPLEYLKSPKKEAHNLKVSLSTDHHLLLFRDADNHLVEAWPLSSIQSVTTGETKSKSRKRSVVLNLRTDPSTEVEVDGSASGSSLILRSKQPSNQVILLANSTCVQWSWVDGFNRLREEKFTGAAFADDMNSITQLELQIRLLGLDLDLVPSKPVATPPHYPSLDGLFL